MQEALGTMRAGFRGRVAWVFQPTRSWHFEGVARYLPPIHYRYVGLRFWHMFQGLGEETAGQHLVINTRLVEYPVEARPIAVSKPESHQCLGDGAPGEREQVPEEESLHSAEGALLAESRAVGDEEATECFEQKGRSGNIVHGKGILLHVMGFIPPASGRNSIWFSLHRDDSSWPRSTTLALSQSALVRVSLIPSSRTCLHRGYPWQGSAPQLTHLFCSASA